MRVCTCTSLCTDNQNMLKILYGNETKKERLTMGRYPAPVVAAIGCGDHPPAEPPVFAAFFGEFHCIPLQKKSIY